MTQESSSPSTQELRLIYDAYADMLVGQLAEGAALLVPFGSAVDLFMKKEGDFGELTGFHIHEFARMPDERQETDLTPVLGDDVVAAVGAFRGEVVGLRDELSTAFDPDEFAGELYRRRVKWEYRVAPASEGVRQARFQALVDYRERLEAELVPVGVGQRVRFPAVATLKRIAEEIREEIRGWHTPAVAAVAVLDSGRDVVADLIEWESIGTRVSVSIEEGLVKATGITLRELADSPVQLIAVLSEEVRTAGFEPAEGCDYEPGSGTVTVGAAVSGRGRFDMTIGSISAKEICPSSVMAEGSVGLEFS